MTETKDPVPSVPVRDRVVERAPEADGQENPHKAQEPRKQSKFLQKMRGQTSDAVEISSQGESAEQSFKMEELKDALNGISTSTPKAARTGLTGMGSASRKGPLGTVSFYNNNTNCRSPAHPIFSPSQGRIVVDVGEGQQVPYEQWYKQVAKRTPLKPVANPANPAADQTAKTLSFSAAAAPDEDAPRCQFLQRPLADLQPRERHLKMLRFSNTVTPSTLRKALAKLTGDAESGAGLDRAELLERYLDALQPPAGEAAVEEEEEEEIEEEIAEEEDASL